MVKLNKKAELETEEIVRWLLRIAVFGLLVAGTLLLIKFFKNGI